MSNTSSVSIINNSENSDKLPVNFQFKLTGDEDKQEIARILKLSSIHGWTITDSYKDLRMVHYEEDADMSVYGHLRGIAVSLNLKSVVGSSFGYTPTAVATSLQPEDDKLIIKDKNGHTH